MTIGPLSSLPPMILRLLYEVARHILRRPVVGVCALARNSKNEILLIRRADTGQWALPGGTLEWGETLASCLERELAEEAGAKVLSIGAVSGVYSLPKRDLRFHAVTVVALAVVADEIKGPINPLEIREAAFFQEHQLPPMSMGLEDALRDALKGGQSRLE